MNDVVARHLTPDALDLLWASGAPTVIPVAGTPVCTIQLDPDRREMSLTTAYGSPEPDVSRMRNLEFRPFVEDGVDYAHVVAHVSQGPRSAYSLLTSVVDNLQVAGTTLAAAVGQAIDSHRDLVAGRGALSAEAELGLIGELLLLERLAETSGMDAALAWWIGPFKEEHDFAFPDAHLEVKTTSSERRSHVIHGIAQLVPTPGIPLYLVSVQVTRSVPGLGRTLAELVGGMRAVGGAYSSELEDRLLRCGWHDDDSVLYGTHWVLRSTPRAYLVDDVFPAMTPGRIEKDVPNFGLVSDVSYRVDVANLDHHSGTSPWASFVEESEQL